MGYRVGTVHNISLIRVQMDYRKSAAAVNSPLEILTSVGWLVIRNEPLQGLKLR